jgi:hypothetical protein
MAVTWVELILHCIQAFGLAQVMAVFVQLSSGFGTSIDLLDDSQLEEIQKVCCNPFSKKKANLSMLM